MSIGSFATKYASTTGLDEGAGNGSLTAQLVDNERIINPKRMINIFFIRIFNNLNKFKTTEAAMKY
jgi:hypothetical protein